MSRLKGQVKPISSSTQLKFFRIYSNKINHAQKVLQTHEMDIPILLFFIQPIFLVLSIFLKTIINKKLLSIDGEKFIKVTAFPVATDIIV